jgi:chromosome segregation ATPase
VSEQKSAYYEKALEDSKARYASLQADAAASRQSLEASLKEEKERRERDVNDLSGRLDDANARIAAAERAGVEAKGAFEQEKVALTTKLSFVERDRDEFVARERALRERLAEAEAAHAAALREEATEARRREKELLDRLGEVAAELGEKERVLVGVERESDATIARLSERVRALEEEVMDGAEKLREVTLSHKEAKRALKRSLEEKEREGIVEAERQRQEIATLRLHVEEVEAKAADAERKVAAERAAGEEARAAERAEADARLKAREEELGAALAAQERRVAELERTVREKEREVGKLKEEVRKEGEAVEERMRSVRDSES